MTFGEKLYKLRKAQGLSQEALAEKLNTSRQAVSKWENNNGYPETEKIILISKIFQITLDDLLIDDKEPGSKEEKNFADETKGFYISRETANGFLFYYKRNLFYWRGRVEMDWVVITYPTHQRSITCLLPVSLQYLQPYQL